MNKGEFSSLQIGTRVKVMRGLSTPPNRGILADKVNESALIRTGHTPHQESLFFDGSII